MTGRVSLVAHRGQPRSFPENSLEGFRHVLKSGTGYVQTYVDISADGIPLLSHDAHLLKLSGKQIIVADISFDQIKQIPAGYTERFGDKFQNSRIASLAQFADLLKDWPDVTCFIELKSASINYFGLKAVDITMEALAEIESQVVLISFDEEAVAYAKKNYDVPVGWVLPEWSEENQQKAVELKPQYLFVDIDFCPQKKAELWKGGWEWVAYTINRAEDVKHYAGLGIELIETNRYSELKRESKIVDESYDF